MLRSAGFSLSPRRRGSDKITVSLRRWGGDNAGARFPPPRFRMQDVWEAGPRQRGTGQTLVCGGKSEISDNDIPLFVCSTYGR